MSKREKKGKTKLVLIIMLVVVILIAGGLLAYKFIMDRNNGQGQTVWLGSEEGVKDEKEPEIKIFSGKDRPIAVM